MKKILILLLSSLIFHNVNAQLFVRELDPKTDEVLLKGRIEFKDMAFESDYHWLKSGMEAYEADEEMVSKLKVLLPKYRYVVFLGTWCHDTQLLIPEYFKTLKMADYPFEAIEMYGLNRDKEAINIEHRLYNIKSVPTFIIMDRFREVGRIVESVETSIEEELLNILESDIQAQSE